MIRFSAFKLLAENTLPDLLLEDRIEFLKNQYKQIDISHDPNAIHKNPSDIIDHFAAADPTTNKAYTPWIVNQYRKKNIRQEDSTRITNTIGNFHRFRNQLPVNNRDINRYQHIADVDTALEAVNSNATSKKEQKRMIRAEGADLIHDGPNLLIHRLKTHKAACLYGAGTKWCTASRDDPSMFNQYSEQGPIYVIQHKLTGKKYQLHDPSGQFMNELDKPEDLTKFSQENPEIKKVPELKDGFRLAHHFVENQEDFDSYFSKFIKNVHDGGDSHDDDTDVGIGILQSPYMHDHHRNALVTNKNLTVITHDMAHALVNWATPKIPEPGTQKFFEAILNNRVTRTQNDRKLQDTTELDILPHISNPQTIDQVINSHARGNIVAVAKNHNLTAAQRERIVNHPETIVRRSYAEHNILPPDHVKKLLADSSNFVSGGLYNNRNVDLGEDAYIKRESFEGLVNHYKEHSQRDINYKIQSLITHGGMREDLHKHLSKIIYGDPDEEGDYYGNHHIEKSFQDINSDTYDKLLDHPRVSVRSLAFAPASFETGNSAAQPHLTNAHIEKGLQKREGSIYDRPLSRWVNGQPVTHNDADVSPNIVTHVKPVHLKNILDNPQKYSMHAAHLLMSHKWKDTEIDAVKPLLQSALSHPNEQIRKIAVEVQNPENKIV